MKREVDFVPVSTTDVEERMIVLRQQQVLLDCDVAALYGVETKRVNEAVSNNPHKFPTGFIFELDEYEKCEVVEIFDRLTKLKYSIIAFKINSLPLKPLLNLLQPELAHLGAALLDHVDTDPLDIVDADLVECALDE